MRHVVHHYRDPLEEIWLATAARIGLRVRRTDDAYATTDGTRTLLIGASTTLDADDSLAQMVFHELCHWMVQGDDALHLPDWGLDNTGERDTWREHACLRLQAHLADRFGLRAFFAPTTDFREFFDQLPPDTLSPRRGPDVVLAILGARRAERPPWAPHLMAALDATADVVRAASRFAPAGSLYAAGAADAGTPPPHHPSGLGGSFLPGTCGSCTWRSASGRCEQAEATIDPAWPRCVRYEPELDCQDCGACCRAAYDSVTVEADDPVTVLHPDIIVKRSTYLEIRREGDRCAMLGGGRDPAEPFGCRIYQDRPVPCRDFERNSDNCLIARRRVGLSL